MMIGLIYVLRVSLSIFNCIAQAWPKLQSKNKIKNALVKWRGKMKIFNVSVQDMNNILKGAVCLSLMTNSYSYVNVSRNWFLFSPLRIISVLMSDDLLTSHRRWLLSWICALKLLVREAKKSWWKNRSWIVSLPCIFF